MSLGDLARFKLIYNQTEEDNGKDSSKITRTKKEYTEDNQRQINRALASVVEQLNSTFLRQQKEDQERFTWLGLG